MEEFFADFKSTLDRVENYMNPTDELKARSLTGLKKVFDFYQKFAKEELRCVGDLGRCKPVSTGPLSELYTEGLDSDQIWEQIQLVNEPVVKGLSPVAASIASMLSKGKFQLLSVSTLERRKASKQKSKVKAGHEEDNTSSDSERDSKLDELDEDLEEEEEEEEGKISRVVGRKSVVDDKFFKLSEMKRFLEMQEKEEEKQDGDSVESDDSGDEDDVEVDYFQDFPSEGEGEAGGKAPCYDDFFDPPHQEVETSGVHRDKEKTVRFAGISNPECADGGEDEKGDFSKDGGDADDVSDGEDGLEEDELGSNEGEDEGFGGGFGAEEEGEEDFEDDYHEGLEDKDVTEDEKQLSKHDKKQLLLKKKITELEDVNLSEKTWQMRGESTAKKRPLNSLLEEDLAVDFGTRPAPVVTEETTKSLEDIVKQRIRDEAWDDVERRVKPAEKPFDYSRARPLEQEKSKLSLAEVYEQEYIKQTQEAGVDKEDERHTEIRRMMQKLFAKLDALSNFHFTPKPPKPEVEIVTNVPAIQMEEVAPVATSDAHLLAPEELQAKSKRPEIGATEKITTDKKRERRLKKKRKRLQVAEKKQRDKIVSKLRPGLGNKYSKKALEKKMKLREEGEEVDKSLRSSSRFFARLQDEVKDQVLSVKAERKAGVEKKRTNAQQYKL